MHRARGLRGLRALSGAGEGPGGAGGAGGAPLLRASAPAVERRLRGSALVRGGFVSPAEAAELLRELEPGLGRRPYQFDHWDGFCGCTIAGLSLLSAAVLRLVSCRAPGEWLELLLEPGSLYVLRDAARYDFTHEILRDEESFFGGRRVPRGRRVSIICRNAPPTDTTPAPPGGSTAFIDGAEAAPGAPPPQ